MPSLDLLPELWNSGDLLARVPRGHS